MSVGWGDFVTAVGLVLVIEGVLLAMAPDRLKHALAALLSRPAGALRVSGLVVAALGLVVVWLVRG
jgi:uncharacterized protein YjeT (DUF2065 family)